MIPGMSLESQSPEGQPAEGSGQRWRLLDDPVVIRALAHPLRHQLMGVIGTHGQATTADAARELGISHGLASHHLRQLAKYGFVEQVKGKDHRERPWRLVATSYRWDAATATQEGAYAVDVLERILAEQALDGFLEWQQRRRDCRPGGGTMPGSGSPPSTSPWMNSGAGRGHRRADLAVRQRAADR